jgi:hypothetical protein
MKIKSSVIIVVIISFLVLIPSVQAHNSIDEKCIPSETHDCTHDFLYWTVPLEEFELPISTKFTFIGENGKKAIIDFGGESIKYSGELTVEESAKLFFEAYGNLCK